MNRGTSETRTDVKQERMRQLGQKKCVKVDVSEKQLALMLVNENSKLVFLLRRNGVEPCILLLTAVCAIVHRLFFSPRPRSSRRVVGA